MRKLLSVLLMAGLMLATTGCEEDGGDPVGPVDNTPKLIQNENLKLISPLGGETLGLYDDFIVKWDANETISSVGVSVSSDMGKSWIEVSDGSIDPAVAEETQIYLENAGTYLVKVYDYTDGTVFSQSAPVTVTPPSEG